MFERLSSISFPSKRVFYSQIKKIWSYLQKAIITILSILATFIYFRNYLRLAREEREREARNAGPPPPPPPQSPLPRQAQPYSPQKLPSSSPLPVLSHPPQQMPSGSAQHMSSHPPSLPLTSTIKKLDQKASSPSPQGLDFSPSPQNMQPSTVAVSSTASGRPSSTQPFPDAILELAKEFQKRSKSALESSEDTKKRKNESSDLSPKSEADSEPPKEQQ